MDKLRFRIQALAALLSNANLQGFLTGRIYQGPLKSVCVPGLNCYSCPGALGACPLGTLQNWLNGRHFRFPYYVVGLLLFFGALLGRAVCGFLCPFGWLQELVNRIPFPVKRNRFRADRPLRRLKYAVLAVLVIALPLLTATPFFCKLVCPAGTLAGVLLAARDTLLRGQLGGLFLWKLLVLLLVLLGCLIVWRPFCKYLCPLGAIYSFFNRHALLRMQLEEDRCVHCGKCAAACRMCVDPARSPNHAECIRCGDCVQVCPVQALHLGVRNAGQPEANPSGDSRPAKK